MTRAMKRDHVRELAESIRKEIEALGTGADAPAKVPAVFERADGTPQQKGDAFWMLDEKPGMFDGYSYPNNTGWHGTLRRCRNTPSMGKQMFATFK